LILIEERRGVWACSTRDFVENDSDARSLPWFEGLQDYFTAK
jgi:hypothetical protein